MKLSTMLLILSGAFSVFGQDVKIKKGVIYLGKQETAKIEGKAETDLGNQLTIKTLGGETIFTVTNSSSDYKYPRYEDFLWYEIAFSNGDKVSLATDRFHLKEKKILEIILERQPAIITGSQLDQGVIDAFKVGNDSSNVYSARMEKTRREIELSMEALKTLPPREKGKLVKLNFDSTHVISKTNINSWTAKTYKIVYDGTVIGSLVYTSEVSSGYTNAEIYEFYVRLKKPIRIDGKLTNYVLAAYQHNKESQYSSIYTFIDNKKHTYPMRDTARESGVSYLIEEGYL